jgi:putative transposase
MISEVTAMHPGASTRELCRLLRVSRARVYRDRTPLEATQTPSSSPETKVKLNAGNAFLRDEIEGIVLKHPWYGYRRVHAQLERQEIHVNHKRVLRLMQLEALTCRVKKRFIPKTTDSKHPYRCYPNLLEKFEPQRLDEVWHADLTYIRVPHFVYLACVLDGYSRRIVGHAISSFMDSVLTLEALQMALKSRQPAPGLIHHSDRGSQYANEKYTRVLEMHGVRISMSRVGVATDNAKIESFFGGLKRECINLESFESLEDVLANVPVFLEAVYNAKRLHSSLGYVPPEEFEARLRSEAAGTL